MKTFLTLFLLLSVYVQAERLPSLKPISSPTTIAETILDAPNKAPTQRFIKTETPKPATKPLPQATSRSPVKNLPATKPLNTRQSVAPALPTQITVIQSLPTPQNLAPTFSFDNLLNNLSDAHGAALLSLMQAQSPTADKATSLLNAAYFYAQANKAANATLVATHFTQHFPQHARLPEALYYVATLGESPAKGRALQQLKIQFEDAHWTRAAAYKTIWDYAKTNPLKSQFKDDRAHELQLRQKTLPTVEKTKRITTILSVVPGAGYAHLGYYLLALGTFIAAALLVWAFMFAMFWGQPPYAAVWLTLLLALYGHSFMHGRQLAEETATQQRTSAFTSWTDLHPMPISKLRQQ